MARTWAEWFAQLDGLMRARPVVAPRDKDLALSQMPTMGPGTPAMPPARGAPQVGGPTQFPDITPDQVAAQKYAQRYRRLLGLGIGVGIADYLGALFPSFVLNQLGPEDLFPEELLRVAEAEVTTVGGQVASAQLFNSVGSPYLLVLEQLWLSATVADAYDFRYNTADLATQGVIAVRDTREGSTISTASVTGHLTLTAGAAAPGGVAFAVVRLQAGVELTKNVFFVLAPGTGLVISGRTQGATVFFANFFWRAVKLPVIT